MDNVMVENVKADLLGDDGLLHDIFLERYK